MIRFVDGVGVMGGLDWLAGGNASAGGGLFGAMLGDAAGSSRGVSDFGGDGRAVERRSRDREQRGSGIEASGGWGAPLERNDRLPGRSERLDSKGGAGREASVAEGATRGEHRAQPRDAADTERRSEAGNRHTERSASREAEPSTSSSTDGGDADSAARLRAEGQAVAADAAGGGAARTAAAAANGSSIRLIAQPGGELGMSLSNTGGRGANATVSRQAGAAQQGKADPEAVVRAASRGINSALAQRGGTITIRLIPETLGALRMQVEVDAGRVSVRIEATNAQAADLLSANAASLRQSLESRGMQVERIHIAMSNAEASRVASTQDPRGTDAERQDEQQRGDRSMDDQRGRHERGGEPEPGPESERGTEARARSPMERFGERLRLILDGVG